MSTAPEKSQLLDDTIIPQAEDHLGRAVMDKPEHRHKSLKEIGRELTADQLRDGSYEGEKFTLLAPMAKALKAEQKAAAVLADAQKDRAEAMALTQKWEEQIEQLYSLIQQCEAVADARRAVDVDLNLYRTHLNSALRSRSAHEILASSLRIAERERAIGLMEQLAEKVAAELAAHRKDMRKWGAANGVPADVLASIGD